MRSQLSMIVALATLTMAGACAESGNKDEAAVTDTSAMSMDTTVQGMDHSQMNQNGPAKDSNHQFMRMMSDHHEGLVIIATQAMDKGASEQTKSDAHMLHTKQAGERDTMVAMISRDYREQHKPTPMAKHQAQADSLSALSGVSYDPKFYQIIIDHHREGLRMIDEFLPRLTNSMLKQMAEKMKADQQKEITEFETKAGR